MKKKKQQSLFNKSELDSWRKEWQDMPEFIQEDLSSSKQIIVHFKTKEDLEKFSKLINQKLTLKTRSIWYPKAKIDTYADKRYIDES